MKKILILGATSAIAEHCARIWANRGYALYLVARNEERLTTIAADLKIRGATQININCTDLNDIYNHANVLDIAEKKMSGIDVVLIAYGTLSHQKVCEKSVDDTLKEIKTNALSVISFLTLIANHFEANRAGTIAVISSVAGERGRASNYVYGSAKAMITAFTSGLRQRLHRSNVTVVTIKPGFVDTPMTATFKKGFFWAKPDDVAKKIVSGIDSRKDIVFSSIIWRLIMILVKIIPDKFFKKINL